MKQLLQWLAVFPWPRAKQWTVNGCCTCSLTCWFSLSRRNELQYFETKRSHTQGSSGEEWGTTNIYCTCAEQPTHPNTHPSILSCKTANNFSYRVLNRTKKKKQTTAVFYNAAFFFPCTVWKWGNSLPLDWENTTTMGKNSLFLCFSIKAGLSFLWWR